MSISRERFSAHKSTRKDLAEWIVIRNNRLAAFRIPERRREN